MGRTRGSYASSPLAAQDADVVGTIKEAARSPTADLRKVAAKIDEETRNRYTYLVCHGTGQGQMERYIYEVV